MIKLIPERSIKVPGTDTYLCQIVADTAAELTGVYKIGGVVFAFGSLALTADGKLLMFGGDRAWHDITNEGGVPADIKYGSSFAATIDPLTYVMTMALKDQNGDTLGTAQTIDLPLEQVVVGVQYDAVNKAMVIVLNNGNTTTVPVGDIVGGLLADHGNYTQFSNGKRLYLTDTEPTGSDIPEGSVWIGGAVNS